MEVAPTMDEQHDVYDTITIMESYNFDKPMKISIICEEHDEVPTFHSTPRGDFVLINQVADILASLKRTLSDYCFVITRCKSEKRKERLRDHWLKARHRLLNECLATSKEFLSQHGVTDQFIKDILSSIEQISKVPLTYELVSNIHKTLLKWIEMKQFVISNNLTPIIDRPFTQPLYSYIGSENVNNIPAMNMLSSTTPGGPLTLGVVNPKTHVRCREVQNIPNPMHTSYTIQDNNTGPDFISHSNYSVNGVHDCQLNTPYIPIEPIGTICYSPQELNISDRVSYNSTQLDDTMSIHSKQKNSDNALRNSISRDSGFMSPVMPGSPLEYQYDLVQYSSIQKEHDASNLYLPAMMPIGSNIDILSI